MRVSPRYLLAVSALSLAVAPTAAHADTIINFGAVSGTDRTFTSYTQGIYTVTPVLTSPNGGWVLNEAQGNPPPAITGGNAITANGTTITESGANQSTITVSDVGAGGQPFVFEGLQLDTYGVAASYTFSGSLGGSTVFSGISGSDTTSSFANLDPSGTGGPIDTLTITLADPTRDTIYAVDNIHVANTPEPSSLILTGSCLLGLAGVVRRRVALPLQRSQRLGGTVHLAVAPRPHHQVIIGCVPSGLQRLPGMHRTIHVLLVPQALQPQRGNTRRLLHRQLVQRLQLP